MEIKKKIAIFAYSLGSGGAEKQISYILNNLHHKYDFTLVLMNNTIFYDIPKDINIVFLENSNPNESGFKKLFKLPFLGWKYKQVLKQKHINLSLSFMTRPNYINIFAKLFGNQIPTIISERSMFSLQYSYQDLQSKINKKLVRLYNHADLIITNAINNGNDLKNNFNTSADITTIYNAVDTEAIRLLKKEPIEPSMSPDTFNFITIGRLDRGKNHQLLLKAIKNTNANLYIIGDGPLYSSLREEVVSKGLENNVFLLGRHSNPYKYLTKADAFVFASNHEGMPNVLLEALACNLPIISTDCQSGPREILAPDTKLETVLTKGIELAEYGILTPIKDVHSMTEAMNLLLQNKDTRNTYRSKIKTRANDFNINTMIKQFIDIIEKMS